MGCDIHSFAERKQENGAYTCVAEDVFHYRSYGLFGWLANVRNYSKLTPLTHARGLPPNMSTVGTSIYDEWGLDAHSPGYVTLEELLAVDYEQIIEDQRCTIQVGPRAWNGGATCAPGEGQAQTLREFLGIDYFAILQQLQQLKADRVVFWFDN